MSQGCPPLGMVMVLPVGVGVGAPRLVGVSAPPLWVWVLVWVGWRTLPKLPFGGREGTVQHRAPTHASTERSLQFSK